MLLHTLQWIIFIHIKNSVFILTFVLVLLRKQAQLYIAMHHSPETQNPDKGNRDINSRVLQGWDSGSQKRSRLVWEAIWKPLDNMESRLQLMLCLVFSYASAQSICWFSVELCLLRLEKIKWSSPWQQPSPSFPGVSAKCKNKGEPQKSNPPDNMLEALGMRIE